MRSIQGKAGLTKKASDEKFEDKESAIKAHAPLTASIQATGS
jgi:hypothetical protein